MARRKKTSLADDITDVVSKLPWWAGVALAVSFYLVLHAFASRPVAAAAQPGQIGEMAVQTIWRTLAGIGQYLLPLFCLVGAAMSALGRNRKKNLVSDVAQGKAADGLDGMSWREFEMLVGEGLRLQGYRVAETGGGGPDGGVDLVLTKPGKNGSEKFLVQCKQWRAFKVGVDVVRELYGVMAARGAAGGFVVTSGRFTEEAKSFASGRNVQLIDGPKLHGLLQQARTGMASAPQRPAAAIAAASAGPATTPPTCPLCSKPMVRREAKRGANAVKEFWGCTGYPDCRGTRPID